MTYHIEGCAQNNRESQKILYNSFYGYAMAVCERYTSNQDDTMEILNDSFLKIFKQIHRYKPAYSDLISSFKGWVRKIVIYTAIDYFRKNHKYRQTVDLDNVMYQVPSHEEDVVDKLNYETIIQALRDLSPGYRAVFNLFVIEGMSHEMIAKKLDITVGSSKSNLSKARKQLQKILYQQNILSLNMAR
jgi:RNA polymerase sigma-70 factor (ECF subfamily)